MKVAVVSDSRRRGGAAVATARVFDILADYPGWDVQWLVSQADGTQDGRTKVFAGAGVVRRAVQAVAGGHEPLRRILLRRWARFRNRRNLLRLVRRFQPAILSLHSINEWTDAALRRTIAADLARMAPVVWTLHDMWPLTGNADYPEEVTDPAVAEDAALERVFSQAENNDEVRQMLEHSERLVFAAPSQWIGRLARNVFHDRLRVVHIPHGVDLQAFRPLPPDEARRWLDVPGDRPVVAAAATSLSARRKGMRFLVEAVGLLSVPVTVMLFGGGLRDIVWPANARVVQLGFLQDTRLLRAAYSAADVFVTPSLAEMFGLVLIEAMACGTPCVGFETGGIPEVIREGKTGYLARRGSASDLARAIRHILDHKPSEKEAMRRACRQVVEQEHDLRTEAKRYADLFAELTRRG